MSLDTRDLRIVQAVPLTDVGHEVAVDSRAGRAYVPLYGTGGVSHPGRSGDGIDVVDLERGRVVDTIPLAPGSRPHHAAWGSGGLLHVTAEGLSGVVTVDPVTGCVVSTLRTAHSQSHMLAVSADGHRVYTADVRPGSLTEVEVASGASRTIALAPAVNRISLAPRSRVAFVADQDLPRLAVVDLVQLRLDRWIALPGIAFGTAPLTDGRHLVLALRQDRRLGVLDLVTHDVTLSTRLPDGPQGVVLAADGRTAYTACSPAGVVVAVDLRSLSEATSIALGGDPDGLCLVDDRAGDARQSSRGC